MHIHSPNKPNNRLLAALSQEANQRLSPHLQQVELPQREILYRPGEECNYAYFPSHSVISSVAIVDDGSATEIGIIGSEGMIGLPIILGTDYTLNTFAIVQIGDGGYKIAAQKLREEFNRQAELYRLLMHYIQARIVQISQTAACNRYHTVEQRLARWLLMVSDSIQKEEFQLTQKFISQMLGVRRSGVSVAASKFQQADIIRYSRGSIKIISHKKLEASSCKCYDLVSHEYNRLMQIP